MSWEYKRYKTEMIEVNVGDGINKILIDTVEDYATTIRFNNINLEDSYLDIFNGEMKLVEKLPFDTDTITTITTTISGDVNILSDIWTLLVNKDDTDWNMKHEELIALIRQNTRSFIFGENNFMYVLPQHSQNEYTGYGYNNSKRVDFGSEYGYFETLDELEGFEKSIAKKYGKGYLCKYLFQN